MKRILVISNGHGEIAIAERIAAAVFAEAERDPAAEPFALDHLPLVGTGRDTPGFPAVGPRAPMPSGGLVAMGNVRAFAGDLAAGFAELFVRQIATVRRVRYDGVVAVGDLYAFGFALLVRSAPAGGYARTLTTAAPAIFVGTAKSVSVAPYGPGERRLLRRARRIFVRDVPTAVALAAHGLPAEAPGNVIVDMLAEPRGERPAGDALAWVAVLPGSRERAYDDALRLLDVPRIAAARGLRLAGAASGAPLTVVCSIAPGLAPERFAAGLRAAGWRLTPGSGETAFSAEAPGVRVVGWRGALGAALRGATLALGQAGTGNEQAAAAGVPVVALGSRRARRGGGEGWYRMRQHRLLGDALALVPPAPAEAAAALADLLGDEARLARMRRAGRERMGPPGGAAAIARAIRLDLIDDAAPERP